MKDLPKLDEHAPRNRQLVLDNFSRETAVAQLEENL